MADLIRLVDTLVTRLKNGKTLVIHCNGGKGRSGTVAVACMVAMGQRVDKSIDVVRKARSGTIRNPLQIVYVKRFKTAFKKYIKRKKALIEARGGSAAMPKEEWDALAQQVAADAVLESSDSSESDAVSLEQGGSYKKQKKDEEKARKEEEKARKEEEKAHEKARKEEEKAHGKQAKEEEKAAEKARKDEEKAHEKARKEEVKTNKHGSVQLSASYDSDAPPSGAKAKVPNHAKTNSTAAEKRSSSEIDAESIPLVDKDATAPHTAVPASLTPIVESPGRNTPSSDSAKIPKANKAPKQKAEKDVSSGSAPKDASSADKPLLDEKVEESSSTTASTASTAATTTTEGETAVANGSTNSPAVPRSNSKKKAKRTAAQADEAVASGTGSD